MKTFTIENQVSPASGRILGVRLTRYGKCVASRRTINDGEAVAAAWDLRGVAKSLGGTHVLMNSTGVKEVI